VILLFSEISDFSEIISAYSVSAKIQNAISAKAEKIIDFLLH
jgi:hypothetical protein